MKKISQAVWKRKIVGWIKEAQKRMFLHSWTIEIKWDITSAEGGGGDDSASVLMNFSGLSEYMNATIRVNLEAIAKCVEEEVRLVCYHEMAHALVLEYTKLAKARCVTEPQLLEGEEKLVQTLAKILAS